MRQQDSGTAVKRRPGRPPKIIKNPTVEICNKCNGEGGRSTKLINRVSGRTKFRFVDCIYCGGDGLINIDPTLPTQAKPGSKEKVAVLRARYAAGILLWNRLDATYESVDGATAQ